MVDEELFRKWEQWFIDGEESHISFASLVFFRSPQPERSWITAAGCVLDTASVLLAAVDRPRSGHAQIMPAMTQWMNSFASESVTTSASSAVPVGTATHDIGGEMSSPLHVY